MYVREPVASSSETKPKASGEAATAIVRSVVRIDSARPRSRAGTTSSRAASSAPFGAASAIAARK